MSRLRVDKVNYGAGSFYYGQKGSNDVVISGKLKNNRIYKKMDT